MQQASINKIAVELVVSGQTAGQKPQEESKQPKGPISLKKNNRSTTTEVNKNSQIKLQATDECDSASNNGDYKQKVQADSTNVNDAGEKRKQRARSDSVRQLQGKTINAPGLASDLLENSPVINNSYKLGQEAQKLQQTSAENQTDKKATSIPKIQPLNLEAIKTPQKLVKKSLPGQSISLQQRPDLEPSSPNPMAETSPQTTPGCDGTHS